MPLESISQSASFLTDLCASHIYFHFFRAYARFWCLHGICTAETLNESNANERENAPDILFAIPFPELASRALLEKVNLSINIMYLVPAQF